MEDYINIKCPHCELEIIIYKNEINCAIFRHGVYKDTGIQIGQHSSKKECDELKIKDLIYGCGKPFKLNKNKDKNEYEAIICDYI
jgi:hypothetical protein